VWRSPEQLSAVLAELNLNGKDGAEINGLADQMRGDSALTKEKYDLLMDHIRDWKVYEMRHDGPVGSYYEMLFPDNSTELLYDDYVNEAAKQGLYGPDWNRYIVLENPDTGEKHYFHPACG